MYALHERLLPSRSESLLKVTEGYGVDDGGSGSVSNLALVATINYSAIERDLTYSKS